MSRPKAYDPQQGYKYQILYRDCRYSREWESVDYATDKKDKDYLLTEYKIAYGKGSEFQTILLPQKYWNK